MFNPQDKPVKGAKRGYKPNLKEIYRILRLRKLEENPHCQICKQAAEDIHHKAGRRTWRLVYYPWFLSVCRNCHTWITEHSKRAIDEGYSLSINTKKPADADDYLNLK